MQNDEREGQPNDCFTVDLCRHPSIKAIKNNWPVAEHFRFKHVSTAKLKIIMEALDPNKATGDDNIPARSLCDCAPVLV